MHSDGDLLAAAQKLSTLLYNIQHEQGGEGRRASLGRRSVAPAHTATSRTKELQLILLGFLHQNSSLVDQDQGMLQRSHHTTDLKQEIYGGWSGERKADPERGQETESGL